MVVREASGPVGLVLLLAGATAAIYLVYELFRLDRIARQRMYVVLILTFFSMLFFAFFEQAGSSLTFFTDRNVTASSDSSGSRPTDVGKTLRIQPTQLQLGYHNGTTLLRSTCSTGTAAASRQMSKTLEIDWAVAPDDVGMGVATRIREIPASTFQSVNPIYILIFAPLLAGLWTFLGSRGWEPSTTFKFAMGLAQVGLGFGAFWYGTQTADAHGMVAAGLAVARLPAAHDGRVVPVAGWALDGHPAIAPPLGRARSWARGSWRRLTLSSSPR